MNQASGSAPANLGAKSDDTSQQQGLRLEQRIPARGSTQILGMMGARSTYRGIDPTALLHGLVPQPLGPMLWSRSGKDWFKLEIQEEDSCRM